MSLNELPLPSSSSSSFFSPSSLLVFRLLLSPMAAPIRGVYGGGWVGFSFIYFLFLLLSSRHHQCLSSQTLFFSPLCLVYHANLQDVQDFSLSFCSSLAEILRLFGFLEKPTKLLKEAQFNANQVGPTLVQFQLVQFAQFPQSFSQLN